MELLKKDNSIIISKKTLATLTLIENGLLGKYSKLMNEQEIEESIKVGYLCDFDIPFTFIFAPFEKDEEEIIFKLKNNDILNLVHNNAIVGHINVETVFKTNKYVNNITALNSNKLMFGNLNIGKYAISGTINIENNQLKDDIKTLKETIKARNAKNIIALFMSADPIHRVHERLIRRAIDKSDLLIIALIKSNKKDSIPYKLKKEVLEYFCNSFLHKNRVAIISFEHSELFSSHENPLLECIAAYKLGATNLFSLTKLPIDL